MEKDHSELWAELTRERDRLARQQEEKELRRYNSFQARAGRTARAIVIAACIVAFATVAILTVYFAIANYGFLVGILISLPFVLVEFLLAGKLMELAD